MKIVNNSGQSVVTLDPPACAFAGAAGFSTSSGTAFASTPYRPVGLATADQGMASVVQLLEWCTVLLADATDGHPNLDQAAQPDRELFVLTAVVLRQTGDLLAGTTSATVVTPLPTGPSPT